ncbi:MAG: radical SAM protein, partial [Eubacterium sp.]|nr:radical SAM protein [Eubacterium sp.]
MDFTNFYQHETDVYSLKGFEPQIVDADYLKKLGVSVIPSEQTLEGLTRGSRIFMDRLKNRTVIPVSHLQMEEIVPDEVETEIHNYTGRCPTLTFELNPVKGCNVGCQYCLVTDGVHEQTLTAYENYHLYVRKLLKEMNGTPTQEATEEDIRERSRLLKELAEAIESTPEKKKDIERQIVELSRGKNWNHYYYYSPKTEAFQEPTLQTGIAHRILKEFIRHFEEYPDSNARLFIASKAGTKHLLCEYEGESILDLFKALKDRMQFNTSVSIMPKEFRDLIEPYAAPIEERLNAVRLCQDNGILSNSALIQPIFTPYLTEEHIKEFFDALHDAGIINYKPEFLTACMENLAMLGQWLGHFDKSLEKALYEDYIMPENADHKKQRGRTAPDRALSISNIRKMMDYTEKIGISTSICYWVRKQLNIGDDMIPL